MKILLKNGVSILGSLEHAHLHPGVSPHVGVHVVAVHAILVLEDLLLHDVVVVLMTVVFLGIILEIVEFGIELTSLSNLPHVHLLLEVVIFRVVY